MMTPLRPLLLLAMVAGLILGKARAQAVPCFGEESNGDFFLSVELLAENIGPLTDLNGGVTDLTGYNTYRIHLNTEGPLDKLSAVYGDDQRPLNINSTHPFHQTPLFSGIANALVNVNNPLLFPSFPETQFDSWLTIGIDQAHDASAGETAIALVEDPLAEFATTFANGGDVTINTATGGAWYIDDADLYTNGDAGADGKVLVAQLTTQGEIEGMLSLQVFRNGEANSENCIRPYLSFQSHGCTEPEACNYDPTAIFDNGTCDFCSCPDSIQILSASFPNEDYPEYSVVVELIADHDTTGITTDINGNANPLDGMKTYRLYATVDNPATKIPAGFGDNGTPLNISSTTDFYQSMLGGPTSSYLSPSLWAIPTYAESQFDSWVTIGIEHSPSFYDSGLGYTSVEIIADPQFTWIQDFESGGPLIGNTGTGLAWIVLDTSAPNVFPDSDLRVLIGQFTTSGVVTGTLGLQIIPYDGYFGEDYRLPFSFTTEGLGDYQDVFPDICTCENLDGDYLCDFEDPCISVSGSCDDAFGCTDSLSWNFDPAANIDDGSCQDNACGIDGTLIVASSYAYDPESVTIPVGGTVVWQAEGTSLYDVNGAISSISGESFGNPEFFNVPSAFGSSDGTCMGSWTFDTPGIYHYDCSILGFAQLGMTGSITVGSSGCLDAGADNYSPDQPFDFEFCEYLGCTDLEACNYDSIANVDDGSCLVPSAPCEDCDGAIVVLYDGDGDGVCDDEEVFGCTDAASCTFLAEATEEDGSCLYADAIGTCGGDCVLDFDDNGICDTDDAAHCGPGTHWDFEQGMCVISCSADIDLDGAIAIGDLLALLSQFANFCSDLE